MDSEQVSRALTWRTAHGDMADEEWELICDLVAPYWRPGRMGRPVTVDRRRVVDAIFYVAATGCQWRALPPQYPNWNTVHRYHLAWSRDGTWEAVAGRLAAAVREREGRDAEPSAGVVDDARRRLGRFRRLWCDAGFKTTFLEHCRSHHIAAEVVERVHPSRFVALPKRWIVERTWSWLMNSRRLQVDYERDPITTEGFIWAAHSCYLLRRLTQPPKP